jgi:hypothetical protein
MLARNTTLTFGVWVFVVSASFADPQTSKNSQYDSLSSAQITELRNRGPEGLRVALLALNDDSNATEFQRAALGISDGPAKPKCEAIDQVAGQRYGYLSRLYWYDDWNAAIAQAKLTQKPILVLKMLGKLTDELSCANSRFFRTALYVDPRISEYLREHYVLCWSSVRPVPKITIEFGEGRKMVRTITGNSAHYVVTADGLVLDALPGMVGPQSFLDWIVRMDQLFQKTAQLTDPKEASEVMRQYHFGFGVPFLTMSTKPSNATNQVESGLNPTVTDNDQIQQVANAKTLILAGANTGSKAVFERPMVKQVAPGQSDINAIAKRTERWQQPESHAVVELSSTSLALIAAENTTPANRRTESESLKRLVANFKQSIADDERQNEQVFHKTIHAWLAESPTIDLESLNNRVYEQLFEMPSDDPWLGLASSDNYSGLCRGGLREIDQESSNR